jgi:hypothetical protein
MKIHIMGGTMDKYTVTHNGQTTVLNSRLVEQQGIDDDTLEAIKLTHVTRIQLFDAARQASEAGDVATLRKLAEDFTALELVQQTLWGFPRDDQYHMWFELPGCRCPKMDNMERRGTPYRVIDLECPIHGSQGYHGDC